MNKVKSFLQQPISVNTKPWLIVVISTVVVFFLLALFQPFGMDHRPEMIKWLAIVGFALVTALCTSIVGYIFPLIFVRFYSPTNWTAGKSLINNFVIFAVIGLGNFFFDWLITKRDPETFISVLLTYQIITFLVGLIPAAISTIVIHNGHLKQNLKDAKQMNKRLMERLTHTTIQEEIKGEPIVLSGNTKDSLEIHAEDILYLEVSGNYVKVNYRAGNNIKQKQLRATIGQMEKELVSYPALVRCHRAFIVNTFHIVNVTGNSQGFQLMLQYTKDEVPVSRSYTQVIREKVEEYKS